MKTKLLWILPLLLAPCALGAGWLDFLGLGRKPVSTNAPAGLLGSALSQEQMAGGLKAALARGVEQAVAALGKPNGFLTNLNVRIPVPESMQRVEKTLRSLKQDKLADDFITTMNRAAEQAVPQGAAILGGAIQQMTLADAHGILTGGTNAATQYFRRTSETNLYERFYPIIQQATAQTGVTSAYKQMLARASFAAPFLEKNTTDLDAYVTHKSLDGLFLKIAEEEQRIREDPKARTTALLQQVFGAIRK